MSARICVQVRQVLRLSIPTYNHKHVDVSARPFFEFAEGQFIVDTSNEVQQVDESSLTNYRYPQLASGSQDQFNVTHI